MTQLSRPYQVALVVLGLFAAVWLIALRGHSTSSSGGGSSAPSSSSVSPASSPAAQPAAPSTPYSGSAPGVAGLTRAIEKAHGAVTQSEQNAKQLQQKSAQASGEAAPGTASGASQAGSQAARVVTPKSATTVPKASATVPKTAVTAPKRAATVHKSPATVNKSLTSVPSAAATVPKSAASATGVRGAGQSKAAATPTMQVSVEGALKRGKLVTILFWNPKGIVDQVVHRELQSVGHSSGGKVAVFAAVASQVGSFGSFTKAVQVNGTPTIVIVNPRGQATTITGLNDVFSIEQAIGEAKK
jgi:hypothetical protein